MNLRVAARSSCMCSFILAWTLALGPGTALAQNTQRADEHWSAAVADPDYEANQGPVVLVDAAHGNFHTVDGGYAAFADVLRQDGYRVRSADTVVTPELLSQGSIFVIYQPRQSP